MNESLLTVEPSKQMCYDTTRPAPRQALFGDQAVADIRRVNRSQKSLRTQILLYIMPLLRWPDSEVASALRYSLVSKNVLEGGS